MGQYLVTQVKNRFTNKSKNRAFVIGVDYDHQRLYDVEQTGQENVGAAVQPQKQIIQQMTPAQILAQKPDTSKFRNWKF
jgi:hypothetical protein